MSRSATRARRRRAQIEEQIEAILERVRNVKTAQERFAAYGELVELLRQITESDFRLWSFSSLLLGLKENGINSQEDNEATNALIAQLVHGRLAASTHGSVHRRQKRCPNRPVSQSQNLRPKP